MKLLTRMKANRTLLSLMATATVFLSGCAATYDSFSEPAIAFPPAFSQSGPSELGGKWWLSFNDAQLNSLIDEALNENFSLKSAWNRLSQAEALYQKNRASLFPSLDGDGDASHTANRADGITTKTDRVGLGLSAAYEVDLWGRIDSAVEAARLDRDATSAELDAAAVSLSGEVASTWYLLVQQRTSLALLDEQIQTNTIALELITTQFRTGQVPMADVLQQRQLIESQHGDRELLRAQEGQTRHRLAILIGRVPGSDTIDVPEQLIDLPELPATGVPAELIQSRPDIRSAFLAVQSAHADVAVAIADQYPRLRLSASLESLNSPTSAIFTDYISSVMAGLTAPLFDGGLRKAEVERTKAAAQERVNDYGQSLLTAVAEVEDALLVEQRQLHYIQSLELQLELATTTIEQVKDRYLKGVENYQRVLTALTSLQALQQSRITAQKDLLLNRVDLCRALGSGWDYSEQKT